MSNSLLTLQSTYTLNSGHEIPLLGFGVLQADESAAAEALRAGYRHIDTAQAYRNEAQVGRAIRSSGVDRNQIFVTTKVMPGTVGYDATARGIDNSLKQFGFDYFDLFLIHDPLVGPGKRLDKYRALLEAQKAGKIRSVGVSNYGILHLEEIREAGLPMPAVNQLELHPFLQQREIAAYCAKHNIAVEAYCPVVRGHMGHPVFKSLAEKYQREPAQILLRWSLQKGFIPLPKSSTPSRIHSNMKLYDFHLAEEDVAKLDALDMGEDGALMWNPVNHP